MGAGSLFFWYFCPKKTPFLLDFVFVVSPAFAGFLVQNLDFHPKRAPFCIPIGRGCCFMSKKSPLLQPRECNAPKTRHHSQIENALRFGRLFQVTLVSPLMSLGHNRSENTILSHARACGITWTPISCRSFPDGREFSSDDLISPHTLGIY